MPSNSSTTTLALPRRSPFPSPRLPRRIRHSIAQFKEYTTLRMRFISLVVRRGLGLVQPRTLDPALLNHGLTLVLPGIESESVFTYGMCDGLCEGGVPGAIRVFNWGLPFPGGYLANLTRVDRNRRRAKDLANEIVAYQTAYPNRPVHLVAQSGGAGIAIFAAEALPLGVMIEGIVLLGAAISPQYNLAPALKKNRKGILNSHSAKDYFVLHLGTRFFGTTDRRFSAAAGCTGFTPPPTLSSEDRQLYTEKLLQLPWTPRMADTCQHWGGHLSSGGETFLANHIAPWVKSG